MLLRTPSALIFAALFSQALHPANGQTTHTVIVGQEGSFYDPPTVSAGVNDTVTFVFAGAFHTVTQTTVNTPCVPLPGGFNSGVAGRGTNISTIPAPTWTIRITNDSQPIWYFCEITTPSSHCAAGMVGAINPPSFNAYQEFVNAAKAVTGTAAPFPSVVLSGSGAFATQSPTTSSASADTSSTSTSITPSLTDSSTPSPTSSTSPDVAPGSSSTKSHLGAIIGGVVGGIAGILIILAALVWCMKQKSARKERHRSTNSDDSQFFRYNVPVRRPSDAFRTAKALENSKSPVVSPNPIPTPPNLTTMRALMPDAASPLAPVRRAQGGTPPPLSSITSNASNTPLQTDPNAAHSFERQASFRSLQPVGGVREQGSTLNMQALANEVAQVLLRSPSGTALGQSQQQQSNTLLFGASVQHPQTMRVSNGEEDDHRNSNPQAPPAYRTAVGSPAGPKAKLQRE